MFPLSANSVGLKGNNLNFNKYKFMLWYFAYQYNEKIKTANANV